VDRLLGLIKIRNRRQAAEAKRRAIRSRGKETEADH
jgi:hypothetical protein